MKDTITITGHTPAQAQAILSELHPAELPAVAEDFCNIIRTVLAHAPHLDKEQLGAVFRLYNFKCRLQQIPHPAIA